MSTGVFLFSFSSLCLSVSKRIPYVPSEVSTFLIFPYFLESHITAASPSLWMMDYQVSRPSHSFFCPVCYAVCVLGYLSQPQAFWRCSQETQTFSCEDIHESTFSWLQTTSQRGLSLLQALQQIRSKTELALCEVWYLFIEGVA